MEELDLVKKLSITLNIPEDEARKIIDETREAIEIISSNYIKILEELKQTLVKIADIREESINEPRKKKGKVKKNWERNKFYER